TRAVRTVARLARTLECALGGLTLPQYRVLAAVDDGGERATHLASCLALAKPTVTAAVDGLVIRGYLEREPVPNDRRSTRIALTDEGRAMLAEAETAMAERLTTLLGRTGDPRPVLSLLASLGPALEPSVVGTGT
ncbi:MAG: MarR family transcriptional regulator, partial [Actinomycetota bacterium]|nr:MarR family transcriptional regulator [Actinomycetota bacterium]